MVASRGHKVVLPGASGRACSSRCSCIPSPCFRLATRTVVVSIWLEAGRFLVDYANTRNADDPSDKRVDLEQELRADLKSAGRDSYDVVAFTHLDTDHFCGSTTFFELRHAAKYQGKDRITIREMWVPAAAIYEDRADLPEEGRVVQAEARYRLEQGGRNSRVLAPGKA